MGITFSSLQETFFPKQKRRIIMFGLDSAGKTSIVLKLTPYKNITSAGLYRFTAAKVNFKNIEFMVWDVYGKSNRRWQDYIEKYCDAIIFVIDSSDHERIAEAESLLRDILIGETLKNVPVLLFANKQDLSNALSPTQVAEEMRIKETLRKHDYFVQGVSAKSAEGLSEGLEYLHKILSEEKIHTKIFNKIVK